MRRIEAIRKICMLGMGTLKSEGGEKHVIGINAHTQSPLGAYQIFWPSDNSGRHLNIRNINVDFEEKDA